MPPIDTSDDTPTNSNSFHPWQPIFLAALCQTGSVAHAAQAAGVTRQNAYLARSTQSRWGQDRLETLAFAEVWREALIYAAETVEVELRQRALEGEEREKRHYYKGECVDVQKYRVYDNRLLLHLAKLVLPTYKDREIFDYPATLRPPTLLDNQFARLDENALDELEEFNNLATDLWCQVFDLLDRPENNPYCDSPEEDTATTDSTTIPAEPTSANVSSNQVSSQSDPADSASSMTETDTEVSSPPISDFQVSSEAEPETPHLRPEATVGRLCTPEAQPSGGSTLGKGDATERRLGPDAEVSSPPPLHTPPPTDFPPPGALVYDFDNAYRRAHGLNT